MSNSFPNLEVNTLFRLARMTKEEYAEKRHGAAISLNYSLELLDMEVQEVRSAIRDCAMSWIEKSQASSTQPQAGEAAR